MPEPLRRLADFLPSAAAPSDEGWISCDGKLFLDGRLSFLEVDYSPFPSHFIRALIPPLSLSTR